MRRHYRVKAVTFLEILLATVIFWIVILSFSSINIFGRFNLIQADRRSRVQNEVTGALEDIAKGIERAVGDANNNPINISVSGALTTLSIWVDPSTNRNGIRDAGDYRIAYQWSSSTRRILFFDPYPGASLRQVATRISSCTFTHVFNAVVKQNLVTVNITGCWDPDGIPYACGTTNNPSVSMLTIIKMPYVSTN